MFQSYIIYMYLYMIKILYIFSSVFLPTKLLNRRSMITASAISPMYKHSFKNDDDNANNGLIRSINNEIYYSGGITDETIFAITSNIINLQNENNCNEINLHIQSKGGSLLPSLGLIDLIRLSDVPINTYVMGYAASAASLISCVGKQRFVNKHGVILIHQLQMGMEYSKFNEIEDTYYNAETLMNIIKEIYLENTNLTKNKLDYLLDHDYWLNSTKCKEYGLVDYIM
jgi:ATP-dependent Clp protease, protease subunit